MKDLKDDFFQYLIQFGAFNKRSMFGGTGIFMNDAMYAILTPDAMFLRGGDGLDERLVSYDCQKFKHVKRSTTAVVNYYDVTALFLTKNPECDELVKASILLSQQVKEFKNSVESRRLRDLPNMRLTLERMVKKAGVPDVNNFLALGAVEVYQRVKASQGHNTDVKLLWMFAGAIEGCHWSLLKDDQKKQLLSELA
jgi:DNA transformation protein